MEGNSGQRHRLFQAGILLLALVLLAALGLQVREQASSGVMSGPRPLAASGVGGNGSDTMAAPEPVAAGGGSDIVVGQSYKNDTSPPLRDIAPKPITMGARKAENENPSIPLIGHKNEPDSIVQRSFGLLAMPSPINTFEGIGFPGVNCNCAPPDTNGEVGPNHYLQMVNTGFAVWNKSGGLVLTPRANNTVWSGFGGPCETQNDGDPIVLYDQLADRWLLSQFTASTPYNECVAVSTTGDPTGSYYRYAFQLSLNDFPDYPHLGVWPDGYYMSVNWFTAGAIYGGPRPYVFDRAKMLQGLPATFQSTGSALGNSTAPILPADLDGATPPPAGAPNYFVGFGDPKRLYKFDVDWTTPANTTFTNYANLDVANFTRLCSSTRNCIPQPSTTSKLDAIGDRDMWRLAYRNFGTHEAMVVNHTVDVGGGQAGVRWYEIRNPGGTPSVFQQGSYAPDATNRWMGSVAMDGSGNIAVGYSASSSSVFPSLRYAGRLAGDPLGLLSQGEATLFAGLGSQTGTGNRWGDYSDITVDPVDDCTFWFTSEYYPSGVSQFNWRTRIGSFKFPSCGGAPPNPTNTPVPGTATPIPPTATPTNTPAPAADFSLSVSPTSQTVTRPGSTTYTVTLTSVNGFSGNVNLSVSGLPSKTTATFSPNPVALSSGGTATSTLTINAQSNGSRGTFTLTITGTGGGQSHSQNVTLTVVR